MPFKSEKQRRYLWANEPEIARDWTDTYGSRIQKKNGGITQAGAINYEPSDMVSVPKEFRARAHSPNTHLAYITDDEAGILQALKPDTPHKGPRGIPNYDSFDAQGGYTSGRDIDDSTGQARGGGSTFSADPVGTVTGAPPPDPANEVVPGDVTYTGNNPWATAWDDGPEFKKDWGPDPETEKKKIEKWESEQDWSKIKKDGKDGWQVSSLWSPETHYNLALNLPNAKKNRLANIKAYKDYLDSQGLDSSWLDPEDLSYEQWQEMKGFKPELAKMPPSQMTNVDYFPQDYEHFMLTQRRNPNIFVSGDLGNFWNKPNPKGAINPDTGLPFTNTEWDAFKKGIIQDRGLSTGNENYGGVPGAVPFGDMPLWQQQGFNSYEDWLATQGGGTTGGGTTGGGTTTTQLANTAWPYKDYGTKDYQTSKTFMDLAYPGGYDFLLARGGRVPAAFGGIMDTETGRRGYFLGSIKKAVKGVAKAAGKVLKSDWGKAALGIGAFMYGPKLFGADKLGGFGGWGQAIPEKGFMAKLFRENVAKKGEPFLGGALSPWKSLATLSPLLAFTSLAKAPKQETLTGGSGGGKLIDPLTGQESIPGGMRQTLNDALADAWNEEEQAYDAAKMATIKQAYPFLGQYQTFQVARDGGRIGAQEGGLMDLGGMEKDYRNNGGFVAIGGEERADDVPARLSRNEFVFTADAVRGAGGGDIDKGAEIMENVMKNLEQGGKISEETQGNTGAQEMFSVSERIGEVL